MKKFLFGFLALALIASNAFAEINFGAYVWGTWHIVDGGGVNNGAVDESGDLKSMFAWRGRVTMSGKTEDGVFGGTARLADTQEWYKPDPYAYGWWKPIDQFKFQIGRNPDGDYGVHDIVGWGFNAEAGDVLFTTTWGNLKADNIENAFFRGFDLAGASLAITPMDGLAINFWMPVGQQGNLLNPTPSQGYGEYLDFGGQVTYNLDGVGRIAVTYQNGTQESGKPADDNAYRKPTFGDPNRIYASFLLTSVENMQVNFGVKYSLPIEVKEGHKEWNGTDVTISNPIAIGLGFTYGAGDFGVKAGLNFDFLGSVKTEGKDAQPIPYNFNLALLPYYDLGVVKAFLGLGINMTTDQEDNDGHNIRELAFGWYVFPYIQKAVGSGAFYAGIQIIGTPVIDKTVDLQNHKPATNKTAVGWAIPIGLAFAF